MFCKIIEWFKGLFKAETNEYQAPYKMESLEDRYGDDANADFENRTG